MMDVVIHSINPADSPHRQHIYPNTRPNCGPEEAPERAQHPVKQS